MTTLIPAIVVEGFISSGKSTFVHQLLQEKKRYALIFDSDVLPQTILYGFEDAKVLREDVAIEMMGGSCVCCTLDVQNIESDVLTRFKENEPSPFDYIIFVSNSFESSFLAELLSCIDEGPLATLATKINLLNIVCLLDCASALVNLKSTQLLNERFKSEFEDVCIVSPDSHTHDGACCHPSTTSTSTNNNTVVGHQPNQTASQFLSVPLTPAALAASNSSLAGSNTSLSGSRKKTVCCPDQGEVNCCQNLQRQQQQAAAAAAANDNSNKESSSDKLVKKGDKPVSSLVFDQLTCASIIILNKIDLVEEDEVEFLSSLVKLINPNVKVLKTELAKVNVISELFGEPSMSVSNYQPVEKKMSGVFITHFYQRVPFHPERLFKFIFADAQAKKINSKTLSSILYLNGFIWLATDMKMNYSFEVNAGYELFTYGNQFYSTMSENEWPIDPAVKESIDRDIKLFKYQDRKSEISIVGVESKSMTQAKFIEQLSKCLLTEQELSLGPNQWESTFINPFIAILPKEDDEDQEEEEEEEETTQN
ncbi:hypothetical protein PPL_08514 [Heterostelium album PN500]|uniref:CobW/HypB/UreG nucleotide-binding domain-containing protein n=1 Tax=Heterostelium pallidum (strain ATCC 26659 / Pp 5 / PN500) TaxID=670386 RepID=D3BIE4_HETP5|nr:hypothetical protein PPL_08514 [Heterostelium album PN500]EFA79044.1 hypothetical protein PPL_08514 [Heterostelium album PN500]|eukprot:XP_020431167.1 hypothetical protein PPL_08514 [Heterostelium album PN500]